MFQKQLRAPFALRALWFIFALLVFVPDVAAQDTEVENRRNEFGIWGAISFDATTLIGKTPDARFGNIGLRYGRILAANDSLAFSWTIDAVPVAVLSTSRITLVPTGSGMVIAQRDRDYTYGAGLSPIGLKLNFRRKQTVQPFVSGTAGFLFFSKVVPEPDAARFNFTYDFGGGIQIVKNSGRAITIGYKYQHISNGYHAPANPGIDVQMIYGGFSIFK
jgi:lipid A 3-O-deacylase PagL